MLICSYGGSLLSNKKQWTIGTYHSKIDCLIVILLMSQAQTSMCCVILLIENIETTNYSALTESTSLVTLDASWEDEITKRSLRKLGE